MGTKYTTEAISGYNSSPPADDGSTAASNQVKWSTIKQKLPDPLKAAIESINSKLVTALDFTARVVTSADSTVAGDHMRTLEVPSTVTVTFTISLGDAATMANGYIVRIRNSSAVDITVGRVTSGDTINGSAANVLLPSGATITFAVNASANGYYAIADASGLILLSSTTASASAQLSASLPSTYTEFDFIASAIIPATDNTDLLFQYSTDGGSTWISTASYVSLDVVHTTASATISGATSTSTSLLLANAMSNTASRGCRVIGTICTISTNPILYDSTWLLTGGTNFASRRGNCNIAISAPNAFRIYMSSGNITSGGLRVWGRRK